MNWFVKFILSLNILKKMIIEIRFQFSHNFNFLSNRMGIVIVRIILLASFFTYKIESHLRWSGFIRDCFNGNKTIKMNFPEELRKRTSVIPRSFFSIVLFEIRLLYVYLNLILIWNVWRHQRDRKKRHKRTNNYLRRTTQKTKV